MSLKMGNHPNYAHRSQTPSSLAPHKKKPHTIIRAPRYLQLCGSLSVLTAYSFLMHVITLLPIKRPCDFAIYVSLYFSSFGYETKNLARSTRFKTNHNEVREAFCIC